MALVKRNIIKCCLLITMLVCLTQTAVTNITTESPAIGETIHASSRDDVSHMPTNLMLVLQRISDRLTTVEALENQQLRKLDNIEYRLTKLEVVIQDKVSNSDKPENQVMRKLEDFDWEMNKFGTMLDVIRQDIDKVQQRQTEIKVALASHNPQLAQSGRTASSTGTSSTEFGSSSSLLANADLAASIQTMASNVQSLRRMADSIQSHLNKLDSNITNINNITRNMFSRLDQLITKQYFQISMKEMFPQTILSSLPYFGYAKPALNNTPLPRDCSEVVPSPGELSGVYQIQPVGSPDPFFVFCDLETEGGGWTVFQRRLDGSIDFLREWLDYKHGFGNLAGEFWLGNEKIYHLTNQAVYELRIELEDFSSNQAYASYSSFALGSEIDGYMIKLLGTYEGSSGDSFTYHASMKFSTIDVDNDAWDGGHCAKMHSGGWWYKGCETANLNGKYLAGQTTEELEFQGVYWYEWHGPSYSLQNSEMKMRKKIPAKPKPTTAKPPAKQGKPSKQHDGKKKKEEEDGSE